MCEAQAPSHRPQPVLHAACYVTLSCAGAVLECIMSEVHGARGDRITAGACGLAMGKAAWQWLMGRGLQHSAAEAPLPTGTALQTLCMPASTAATLPLPVLLFVQAWGA